MLRCQHSKKRLLDNSAREVGIDSHRNFLADLNQLTHPAHKEVQRTHEFAWLTVWMNQGSNNLSRKHILDIAYPLFV